MHLTWEGILHPGCHPVMGYTVAERKQRMYARVCGIAITVCRCNEVM